MLEIACFNLQSALAAAAAGADRIEFCADYAAGGLTPSYEALCNIRKVTTVPVNVMIRPRPGDFTYSESEFETMCSEIQLFKEEASGFVFGVLDDKNRVDEARNRELVRLAAPLPCTFHRAFDQVPDMFQATEKLISCGFTSILTSGGQPDAASGSQEVAMLHQQLGDKITFILGGGVRSTNLGRLKEQTECSWYHSAAITTSGEAVDPTEVTKLQTVLSQVT